MVHCCGNFNQLDSHTFSYSISLGVAMHALSHVASSLFNILFPHSDMSKQIGLLKTGSYVTEGSSYSASFFASFSLFIFLWMHYDSLYFVELSSSIMLFDSSSSVEQTCNKFFPLRTLLIGYHLQKNVQDKNLFSTSHFRYYRVNVQVQVVISCHTLYNLSFQVRVTVSRIMVGPHPLINFISQFLKLPDHILKVLQTYISNGIACLFCFFGLALAMRPIEVINHFPDLTKLYFSMKT